MRCPELNNPVSILEAAFNHPICAITKQTHIPYLENCWKGERVKIVGLGVDTSKNDVMKLNFRTSERC